MSICGPFDPMYSDLPNTMPIFPLGGALLLPRGHLPLNVFEPRYLNMVTDALGQDRMIGMIQPRPDQRASLLVDQDNPPIFNTGPRMRAATALYAVISAHGKMTWTFPVSTHRSTVIACARHWKSILRSIPYGHAGIHWPTAMMKC